VKLIDDVPDLYESYDSDAVFASDPTARPGPSQADPQLLLSYPEGVVGRDRGGNVLRDHAFDADERARGHDAV
jgi:hypothetical protein